MTYVYIRINQDEFARQFEARGLGNRFSNIARNAIFGYLEYVAAEMGAPVEVNVEDICCEFTEYATLAEYNEINDTQHLSWGDVKGVCVEENDRAIVRNQNHNRERIEQ